MWGNLIAVLQEMLVVYTGLVDLSKKKREALVAAKVNELETITKQEELLIIKIGKLEKQRQTLADDLAHSLGLDQDQLHASELKDKLPQDWLARWDTITGQLEQVIAELQTANALNTRLLEQSLSFINYNLNVLASISKGAVYESGGKTQQEQTSRLLVDKKV